MSTRPALVIIESADEAIAVAKDNRIVKYPRFSIVGVMPIPRGWIIVFVTGDEKHTTEHTAFVNRGGDVPWSTINA